ncbi:hypothetical protein TSOC_010253, partial [Tetrabaena socialis]
MDTAGVTQAVVEGHIKKEVLNLGSADATVRAQAMAGLAVLLTQLQEPCVPPELMAAVPGLCSLLEAEDGDSGMQANACAILGGLMAFSDELQAVVADGLVAKLQQLLAATATDQTLQHNVLTCMSEALRDREADAEALAAAGGLVPVLRLCDPTLPERLQEAAADVLCAVASAEGARATMSEQ